MKHSSEFGKHVPCIECMACHQNCKKQSINQSLQSLAVSRETQQLWWAKYVATKGLIVNFFDVLKAVCTYHLMIDISGPVGLHKAQSEHVNVRNTMLWQCVAAL